MRVLDRSELAKVCGEALGVADPSAVTELIKPALRRAVFLLAPCSSADLIGFVAEPLSGFENIREVVEQALTEMIAYGDILEMKRLQSDPWDAPPYSLRPAPPSFVLRSNGDAIILGVAGEMPSALTAELDAHLKVEGPVRVLRADIEPLAAHLKLLGLIQLSEHVWLRTPKASSARDYLDFWNDQLGKQPPSSGRIEGFEILDPSRPNSYYRGRWREPEEAHSGRYVARRSQEYGAKLWSFAELERGKPVRILDLLAEDDWERPCDIAWRLQAAIDALNGKPQGFAVRKAGSEKHLDFSSPLPAFAERRLALVATKRSVPGALFRFEMAHDRAQSEISALQSTLWMQPLEGEKP